MVLAGAVATCAVVLALGVASGLTAWAPKWPPFAGRFLAGNLLFTCVAEEAFFRGLVQERLTRLGDGRPSARAWTIAGLALATLLFGLAHAGGGPRWMLAAGVAGLGDGAVYARTRRLAPAVLVHFALNAVHFVGFVYPQLAS